MTTLLLIRHGQTDWNLEGRYQGQSDVPINAAGREQARQLASQLVSAPPEAIYSSDLARARETAEIIAGVRHLPVRTDPRLREINQGVWEGMLFSDIKTRFALEFERRKANPLAVAPPGGETVGQVRDRVLAAVTDIVRRHPAGCVAVVSHGLALALIRAYATGYPVEKVWDLIPPNAEVEAIEIKQQGVLQISGGDDNGSRSTWP